MLFMPRPPEWGGGVIILLGYYHSAKCAMIVVGLVIGLSNNLSFLLGLLDSSPNL